MAQISLFQLLTPLMLMVFAGGFAAIYLYDRSGQRSALFFALSYLAAATGFLLDFFRAAIPYQLMSFLTNGPFLASTLLFAGAMHTRYGKPWPLAAMTLLYAGTLTVNFWFLVPDPNIVARIVVINAGGLSLFLFGFAALKAAPRDLIRKAMFWLMAATCAQFVIRPAMVLMPAGQELTPANYGSSVYFVTFHFVMALLTMAFAAVLFISYGMDIVRALNRRSDSDHLSGLLNRRGFEGQAGAVLAAAAVGGGPLPVMVVCDLDHFKRINDRFGHAAGDNVIQRMGYAVQTGLVGGAIAGRIGGEEFAVLLPRTTISMARLWCEGMKAALAAPSEQDGPECDILPAFTASFGIAAMQEGDNLHKLMSRADQALYCAKHDGRNCVRIAA